MSFTLAKKSFLHNKDELISPSHKGYPLSTQYTNEFNEKINRKIRSLNERGEKQRAKKKIFSVLAMLFLFAFGLGFTFVFSYITLDIVNIYEVLENQNKNICPFEIKVCDDGSRISRIPPRCSFAKCPSDVPEKSLVQSNVYGADYKMLSSEIEELISGCDEDQCCLESLEYMRENDYFRCGKNNICPKDFYCNKLKCTNSYAWCEAKD